MTNNHAPTLGLVEMPALGDLLRQMGYRVISGSSFPEAASAVKTALDEAADPTDSFPILIADVHRPGIKAWAQKHSRITDVVILRGTDEEYIVAADATAVRLPVSVGHILTAAGLPVAPDEQRLALTVTEDGTIIDARTAPAPQVPTQAAAPVTAPAPAAPAFGTFVQPEHEMVAATVPVIEEYHAPVIVPVAPAAPSTPPRAPWDNRPAEPVAVIAPVAETPVVEAVPVVPFERTPQTLFMDPEPEEQVAVQPKTETYVSGPGWAEPSPFFNHPVAPAAEPVAPVAAPIAAPIAQPIAQPIAFMAAERPRRHGRRAADVEPDSGPLHLPVEYVAPVAETVFVPVFVPAVAQPVFVPAVAEIAPVVVPAVAPVVASPAPWASMFTTASPVRVEATAPVIAVETAAPAVEPVTYALPAPVEVAPAETPSWMNSAVAPETAPVAPAWSTAPLLPVAAPVAAELNPEPVFEPKPAADHVNRAPAPAPLMFPSYPGVEIEEAVNAPALPWGTPVAPIIAPGQQVALATAPLTFPSYPGTAIPAAAEIEEAVVAPALPWSAPAAPVLDPGQELAPVLFNWAYKGGVNKTSLCLQLAHRAAERGLRVWLIDMNRGQGGIRTLLNISDTAPVRSAFDAARLGDPTRAFLRPAEAQKFRPAGLEPLKFGLVLAPPRSEADPASTPFPIYQSIINQARATADLVIVDTQTVEAVDNSGLISNVMLPMMIHDAWGLAITEFAKESVENLKGAFAIYQPLGLTRERQLLAVTRARHFLDVDGLGVERTFSEFANFVGTTAPSDHVKEEFDRGNVVSDDPAVRVLLDTVLQRITGDTRFVPVAEQSTKAKRRFFGGGKK